MKILYLYLTVLYSCENIVSSPSSTNMIIIKNTTDTQRKDICERIINDDIFYNILPVDIVHSDTTTLKKIFYEKPEIQTIQKKSLNDNHIYSYYIFKTQDAYIQFFENQDKYIYIDEMLIKGHSIKLHENISIDMFKDQFLKQLKIKHNTCDTIIVTNEDQQGDILFIFNKNHLKQIQIKSSLE